ncbi:beta-lactamase-like protein [Trametes polyzona]|nr:beta-lactamase-like protein [Trametes polyzona]
MGSIDAFAPSSSDDVEFILLGTGTSSTIPHVDCLTAPPGAKRCRTCLSTLHPDGKKNIRRNTSAVARVRAQNGELVTIVIDVGKSFQQAAVEWFPKYGLRKIDAVLITHAHADAMNGLDDLRGWTLHGAIQPHVDLYVSLETFQEVGRAFPYLISKEFASGGGDVPEFNWHIIEDRKPFTIGDTGIVVDPFKVHHGRVFSVAPPVDFTPSPNSVSPASTNPPTPGQPGTPVRAGALTPSSEPVKEIFPYFCFGFTIQHAVTYISDVSHIPEDVWEHIRASYAPAGRMPVLVLDCLRLEPHTSHLSLAQAVDIARRMGARKTYLTGFSHEVAHEEYRTILEAVGGRTPPQAERTEMVRRGLETLEEGSPVWVRPAFDGLRVFVSPNGKDVWDSEYHD